MAQRSNMSERFTTVRLSGNRVDLDRVAIFLGLLDRDVTEAEQRHRSM